MPPLVSTAPAAGTPSGNALARAAAGSMGGVRVSVFSDMQTFVDNRAFLAQIIGQYHVFNVDHDAKVVTEDLLELIQYILKSSVQFVDKELLGKKVIVALDSKFERPSFLLKGESGRKRASNVVSQVADESFEEPKFLKGVIKNVDGVSSVPYSHVINRIQSQVRIFS